MRLEPEKVMQNIGSMIYQNFQNFEKMIKRKIEICNFREENAQKIVRLRGTLRVLRAETWLTVYRTIASNTETIAKLARLGPAKNDTTLKNFIELTMFCSMTLIKVL